MTPGRLSTVWLRKIGESAADGAVRGRLHHLGVLAEDAAGVLRLVGSPAVPTGGGPGVLDGDIQGAVGHVEGDLVTVAHEGDRAGVDGLGGDVAHAQAGRTSREA